MPSSQPRGPPRRASAYEISKSTGFHVDFRFQNGFLDFKRDFWISKCISGFQSWFLDFTVDFWISSGFLDFIWIAIILNIQLKYIHDSWTAFLSTYMLTEYKVTGTSPLHSAQAACSLIVIHIHTHTACSLIVIQIDTNTACSLIHTYSYVSIDIHTHTMCSLTSCIIHQPNNYNYITSEEWPLHPTEDRPGTKVIHCGDILLHHKTVHVHACEIFNESIRIFADYFNRILDWISGF